MDELNIKFNNILATKSTEIEQLAAAKNIRTKTDPKSVDELSYNLKTTIYKINAEQEKKIKSSKAYKNKELLYSA
jgi:phage-related minor tail protein